MGKMTGARAGEQGLLESAAELLREGVSVEFVVAYLSAMTSPVRLPGGAS